MAMLAEMETTVITEQMLLTGKSGKMELAKTKVMTDLTEKMVKTALMVRRDKMRVMGTIENRSTERSTTSTAAFCFVSPILCVQSRMGLHTNEMGKIRGSAEPPASLQERVPIHIRQAIG